MVYVLVVQVCLIVLVVSGVKYVLDRDMWCALNPMLEESYLYFPLLKSNTIQYLSAYNMYSRLFMRLLCVNFIVITTRAETNIKFGVQIV